MVTIIPRIHPEPDFYLVISFPNICTVPQFQRTPVLPLCNDLVLQSIDGTVTYTQFSLRLLRDKPLYWMQLKYLCFPLWNIHGYRR
jgi:hypothetical protein